jgi:hypothetical protein
LEAQIFAIQTLMACGARIWDSTMADESTPVTADNVPAPLDLLAFDILKSKIKRIARKNNSHRRSRSVPVASMTA